VDNAPDRALKLCFLDDQRHCGFVRGVSAKGFDGSSRHNQGVGYHKRFSFVDARARDECEMPGTMLHHPLDQTSAEPAEAPN
jgi:hypothetical protein